MGPRIALAPIVAIVVTAPGVRGDDLRPPILEEAAAIADELEEMEAPYGMLVPTKPVVEELVDCLRRLDAYLIENPTDLEAAVLGARLDRQTIRAPSAREIPDMSGPHARLDGVLNVAPNHAEAHHWKSKLHGELVLVTEQPPLFEPENLDAALEFASRAVELEPDNAIFRENLALLLVENEEPDQAIEALAPVAEPNDALFEILSDFAALPLPPNAVPLLFSRDALTLFSSDVPADRYARQRVRAYALNGPAEQVERFYAGQWEGFKLLDAKSSGGGSMRHTSYRQWIAYREDSWRVATNETELPAPDSFIQDGLTVNIDETVGLPIHLLRQTVPEDMIDEEQEGPQVLTVLRFIHHQMFLGGLEKDILNMDDWVPSSPPSEPKRPEGG